MTEEAAVDTEFGTACVECEALTPCVTEVVVKCHDGGNTRVTLKGENELEETDGTIYFVADQFVSGEASFEAFLKGSTLKDTSVIDVTVGPDCTHGSHTARWERDRHAVACSTTTTLNFETHTNPRPTILNVDIFQPTHEAFEVIAIVLDILINRTVMRKETEFTVTGDDGSSFSFKAVTVPQLKFIGAVAISPPTRSVDRLTNSQGRALANEVGMGPRARQVTNESSWAIAANLMVVVGNNTKNINIGNYNRTTRTIDSGPSLRRQRNAQSGFDRFVGAISNAAKTLSGNLSGETRPGRVFNFYAEGPTLVLELGTEQREESNGPGLTWVLTAGLSLEFKVGMRIDIYEALKRAARRHPAGAALVAFLEDAEDGRDLWVASYQLQPSLYLDLSLSIGSAPTEDMSGDANLTAECDLMTGDLSFDGHITGSITAEAGGGVQGEYDTIFTSPTVFRYEATVSTTGGITIKTECGEWGYQLFHRGAVLRVISVKRISGADQSASQTESGRSRSNTVTTTTAQWVPDGEQNNTYRLADTWTGSFTPF